MPGIHAVRAAQAQPAPVVDDKAAAAAPQQQAPVQGDLLVAGARAIRRGNKPAQVTGFYSGLVELAAKNNGKFEGMLKTQSGEIFVAITLPKDKAATTEPVIYLDGIAARHGRAGRMAEPLVNAGHTAIQIYLPWQGETLDHYKKTHNDELPKNDAPSAQDQAKAVVDVLDALGVKAKASVSGLSYGGAIAFACKAYYPERFDKCITLCGYTQSVMCEDESTKKVWDLVHHTDKHPAASKETAALLAGLNALCQKAGVQPATCVKHEELQRAYRETTKVGLDVTFNGTPFTDFFYYFKPKMDVTGLTSLTMGIDGLEVIELAKQVPEQYQKDFFTVCVPDDGAVSNTSSRAVFDAMPKAGGFVMCPDALKGKHDMVSADPAFAAWCVDQIQTGKIKGDITLKPTSGNS